MDIYHFSWHRLLLQQLFIFTLRAFAGGSGLTTARAFPLEEATCTRLFSGRSYGWLHYRSEGACHESE